MQNNVVYRPSYSLLQLMMQPGETLRAEAGAMVSMTPNIKIETAARGVLKGDELGHAVSLRQGVSTRTLRLLKHAAR